MKFFEWNRNGKMDFQDAFLEYKIYEDCMEDYDEDDLELNEYDEFFDDFDEE